MAGDVLVFERDHVALNLPESLAGLRSERRHVGLDAVQLVVNAFHVGVHPARRGQVRHHGFGGGGVLGTHPLKHTVGEVFRLEAHVP